MDGRPLSDREIAETVLGGPIPPAEAKSRIEARTLASGQVAWAVTIVPGTVADDDLFKAVDLARDLIEHAHPQRKVAQRVDDAGPVFEALQGGPKTMQELGVATGLSDPSIRKHLKVLADAGAPIAVEVGPRGKKVYSIDMRPMFKVRLVKNAP